MVDDDYDIIGLITGVDYPEASVRIGTDRVSAYKLAQLQRNLAATKLPLAEVEGLSPRLRDIIKDNDDVWGQISALSDQGLEETRELLGEIEALKKKISDSSVVVTIRGYSNDVADKIRSEVLAANPDIQDEKSGLKALARATRDQRWRTWFRSIVSIEFGDKKLESPSKDDIKRLINGLGESEIARIDEAIEQLQTNIRLGFEYSVKSPDFS